MLTFPFLKRSPKSAPTVSAALLFAALFFTTLTPAQTCQKSTDCPGVLVCDGGQCRNAGSASTAPAPAYCASDAQCSPTTTCVSGSCVAKAASAPTPTPEKRATPVKQTAPAKQTTAHPSPAPAADGSGVSTDPPELAALKLQREETSIVAPILLIGLGAAAILQGVAMYAINQASLDPVSELQTVSFVFIGVGGAALIGGSALLPVRISKRRSLDAQIKALSTDEPETSLVLSPAFIPKSQAAPAFYGALLSGHF